MTDPAALLSVPKYHGELTLAGVLKEPLRQRESGRRKPRARIEKATRNAADAAATSIRRSQETTAEKTARNAAKAAAMSIRRSQESMAEKIAHHADDAAAASAARASESSAQKRTRRQSDAISTSGARAGEHGRRYNAPASNEVSVIVSGDQHNRRDIVIESCGSGLRRISETHRSYDALQYPLLFPYGEDGFPIHERSPAIVQLVVHLENDELRYFSADAAMDVASRTKDTTLTAFFKLCRQDEFARTLLYPDVPSYYVWTKKNTWARRKRGANVEGYPGVKKDATLGRVFTVPPSRQECFYLRLILHEVSDPTSYNNIRTVNGVLCDTFREACMQYSQAIMSSGGTQAM
ncbi:unnamed protein product [Acanthosepion pharaonis]|uniref:Uncharacterized protein n=1 Tax=Acanthosepion pharaonis TaxID=158019 RepID=A0A812ALC2_ACAPH|nr:unnamed protein product [Sepia pharaonis]